MQALFKQYGAPLVLKSDSGSAFIAGASAALLAAWGVWPLFSPPRTPRYNGSCEAGIGSMKTRTHHQAARGNHAGDWTCADAEAARQQANETGRPWGSRGPTPAEVWAVRQPVAAAERTAFAAAVAQAEREARRTQGYAADAALDHKAQAAVHRLALPEVLLALGLLRLR